MMNRDEKIEAYLAMSPRISLLALNHHYEAGEILDNYQKFDLNKIDADVDTTALKISIGKAF